MSFEKCLENDYVSPADK